MMYAAASDPNIPHSTCGIYYSVLVISHFRQDCNSSNQLVVWLATMNSFILDQETCVRITMDWDQSDRWHFLNLLFGTGSNPDPSTLRIGPYSVSSCIFTSLTLPRDLASRTPSLRLRRQGIVGLTVQRVVVFEKIRLNGHDHLEGDFPDRQEEHGRRLPRRHRTHYRQPLPSDRTS